MALGLNALILTLITLELGFHLNLGISLLNNKMSEESKNKFHRFGQNFELDAITEIKPLIRLLNV